MKENKKDSKLDGSVNPPQSPMAKAKSEPPVPQPSSEPPELPMFTLTIKKSANGTTKPEAGSYKYPAGQQLNIVPTPDVGYYFKEWTIDAAAKSLDTPLGSEHGY